MAEKSTSSNVTRLRAVTAEPQSGPQSLEERLAIAREKRARVLAAKGQTDQAPPKLSKPWLETDSSPSDEDDFDPAATITDLHDEFEEIAQDIDDEPVSEAPAILAGALPPNPPNLPGVASRPHRVIRAGLLGLVAGFALVAGAAITNIDRLPEITAAVTTPVAQDIAMTTAPSPGQYLAWDPVVFTPGTEIAPNFQAADHLAPYEPGPAPTLPRTGSEISMITRLAIGAPSTDVPPRFDGRILIFAPDTLEIEETARLAQYLQSFKLKIGATTPVAFSIPANEVRYFHRDDRDTARSLSRMLGGALRQYPVKRDDPPEPGIIELWIADQP